MLTIGICDDNPVHLEHIKELLSSCEIGRPYRTICVQTVAGLTNAMEKYSVDMVLLDIDLGIALDVENGITLGKRLKAQSPYLELIFISAHHAAFHQEAYLVQHVAFVHKPIEMRFLRNALHVAIGNIDNSKTAKFGFLSGGLHHVVPHKDICRFERDRRVTRVYTAEKGVLMTSDSLPEILGKLQNWRFVRCHESYIVNRDWVEAYKFSHFIMQGGDLVTISRKYKDEVAKTFSRFAMGGK